MLLVSTAENWISVSLFSSNESLMFLYKYTNFPFLPYLLFFLSSVRLLKVAARRIWTLNFFTHEKKRRMVWESSKSLVIVLRLMFQILDFKTPAEWQLKEEKRKLIKLYNFCGDQKNFCVLLFSSIIGTVLILKSTQYSTQIICECDFFIRDRVI